MLTNGTKNLPEPLARMQAAEHGTARLAPVSADRLARRMEHFASSVQFVLEDSDAARRLHALTGHLIGMVSTHCQCPHRPSDRDLRIMELYADFAGEALAAHLGRPSGNGPADPVGRALVTALLDPAHVGEPDVSVPFELWVMVRMTVSLRGRSP